jgi:hypothetical protein
MSDHAFLDLKIHTTKSARPLGVKGLGPISAFWPITNEDFKPLTQRIGPASRCTAALNMIFNVIYYLELHNATTIYCTSHNLPKNVKLVVWNVIEH